MSTKKKREKNDNGWLIYKRLLLYVKPYKWQLGIGFASMLLFALFQVLISAVVYVTVNGFVNKGGVDFGNLPHVPFLKEMTLPLLFVPIFVGGVFFLKSIFEFMSSYIIAIVGLKAVRNIRNEIYSHLHYLSLDFFSKGRTGDLMSRTISDVNHIQGAITDVLVDMVKSPAVILFNIPMIFILGGKLGLIAVLVLPLVVIPVAMLGRKVRKFTRRSQESAADITSIFHEAITGVRVVKAFNQEENEIKKFKIFNNNVFRYLKRQTTATIIQGPIIEMLGGVAAGIGLWYGIHHLEADRLAGFLAALYVFYEPIKKLSKVNSAVQRSIASGKRIFEITDTPPSITDRPGASALGVNIKTVDFDEVGFHYEIPDETGKRFSMKNINIDVKNGDVIALVGTSGSGKSSLVNLLPRFYDVTSGSLKINGKDIRDYTLASLRRNIGTVTQDVVLFNDTVKNNIGYGYPEATMDEVVKAAKAAHAHEFIERLDKGYDTVTGERGVQLSGGQRQRLSIARAIVKSPPILVLDEATSSLDTESEREIQKAIDELMEGRTVFVIAHRLSTVQHATKILVFDKGCIVQEGTHKSLLAEGGQYKRLHDLQFNT